MRKEKKYPAEHLEGKKVSCPPDCWKNIFLITRNHPPPSRVKWSAPYIISPHVRESKNSTLDSSLGIPAGCKESHFYSLPFGQAEANIY